MPETGLNARYLRPHLQCSCTAEMLARSWREGRITPDEVLVAESRTLTFREACQENTWLGNEIGPIPEFVAPKERSWWAEWCFRRAIWRRIVMDGEYVGISTLFDRIDKREAENCELIGKVEKAELDRKAAFDEVHQIRKEAENRIVENEKRTKAEVDRARKAEAVARESEKTAMKRLTQAQAARARAEENARVANDRADLANVAKKGAELALVCAINKDAVHKSRVVAALQRRLVVSRHINTRWNFGGIPRWKLSSAIFSYAKNVAPDDVLAFYGWWHFGIVVTPEGIVGSGQGGTAAESVFIRWGWATPLILKGNILTGATVWNDQQCIALYPLYVFFHKELNAFLTGIEAANADLRS